MKSGQKYRIRIDRMFTYKVLRLIIFGILLNVILSKVVLAINAPLYLDNIGSILVGALAGPIPGMIAAFISNYLGYFGEPTGIMFGLLTVAMAYIAAVISQHGLYKKWSGYVLLFFITVLIGGAGGSVLGWYVYGKTVGGTIAAPYVFFLCNHGLSGFLAQFLGDIILDITDKGITVLTVALVLHFFPEKWRDNFPLGYIYGCSKERLAADYEKLREPYDGDSVYIKIVKIITVAVVILAVVVNVYGTGRYTSDVYMVDHNMYNLFAYAIQLVGLERVEIQVSGDNKG